MSVVSPTNDSPYSSSTNKPSTDDGNTNKGYSGGPQFEDLEVYNLFGTKVDRESTIIFIFAIICWCLIWRYSSLKAISGKANIMYFVFFSVIVFFIVTIFTSDVRAADYVTEEMRLGTVEQTISVVSAMLFALVLFSGNILSGTDASMQTKNDVLEVMLVALIPALIGLLYVSVTKDGTKIRILRKAKQSLNNITIGLMLSAIVYATYRVHLV